MTSTIIQDVLRECYSELEGGFYSPRLVSHLYSKECVSVEEKQNIEACTTQFAKSRKLLDYLINKSDDVLQTLMEFFNHHAGYEHLRVRIQECAQTHGCKLHQAGQGDSRFSKVRQQGLPTKWWPVFKEQIRPQAFVERQGSDARNLIQLFRQELQRSDFGTSPTISKKVAIVGMAGVGKSTIAKWYANVYQKEYDHILWIDSEGGSLGKSFKNLGQELGMNFWSDVEIQFVVRRIQQHFLHTPCLFIFDNAESFDGKNGLKNFLPRNELHHTIVTSRNQHWGNPNEFGQMFTWCVDIFTVEECLGLLSRTLGSMGKGGTKEEMVDLGKELQFLPLAIQTGVAAILKSKHYTLKSYLERVQKDICVLIAKEKILSEYERSIWATFQLSIEQIEKNEEIEKNCRDVCKTILFVAAYWQPSGAQEFMFVQPQNKDDSKVGAAIEILLQYSLLSFETSSLRRFKAYGMHRLLQHVVREIAMKDPVRATHAIGLIVERLGGTRNKHCDEVQLHALYAWQFGKDVVERILSTNRDIQPDLTTFRSTTCLSSLKSKLILYLNVQNRPLIDKLYLKTTQVKFRLMDTTSFDSKTEGKDEYFRQVLTFYKSTWHDIETIKANTTCTASLKEVHLLRLHLRIILLGIMDALLEYRREQISATSEVAAAHHELLGLYASVVKELEVTGYDGIVRGVRMHVPCRFTIQTFSLRKVIALNFVIRSHEAGTAEASEVVHLVSSSVRQTDAAKMSKSIYNIASSLKSCPDLLTLTMPKLFENFKTILPPDYPGQYWYSAFIAKYSGWLVKSGGSESEYLDFMNFCTELDWMVVFSRHELTCIIANVLVYLQKRGCEKPFPNCDILRRTLVKLVEHKRSMTEDVGDTRGLFDRIELMQFNTECSYVHMWNSSFSEILLQDAAVIGFLNDKCTDLKRFYFLDTLWIFRWLDFIDNAIEQLEHKRTDMERILESKLNIVLFIISKLEKVAHEMATGDIEIVCSFACYILAFLKRLAEATELWKKYMHIWHHDSNINFGLPLVSQTVRQMLQNVLEPNIPAIETKRLFMLQMAHFQVSLTKNVQLFPFDRNLKGSASLLLHLFQHDHHQLVLDIVAQLSQLGPKKLCLALTGLPPIPELIKTKLTEIVNCNRRMCDSDSDTD